jgi:hypothetical protein
VAGDSLFAGVDVGDPSALAGFADEYKSEYQPPPLRMNEPPLIWRFAVCCPHLGQTSTGAAEIF